MSTDKKPMNKKLKITLITIGIIVILGLCAIFVAHYATTLVNEGQVEFNVVASLPENFETTSADGAIAYLNSLTDAARDTSVSCVDRKISIGVNDDSVTYSGSDAEKGVIKFLKNDIISKLYDENYIEHKGRFLEDFKFDLLIQPVTELIKSVETTQGVINEDNELTEDERYFINIAFNDFVLDEASEEIIKTFSMEKVPAVCESAKDIVSEMVSVKGADISCKGFEINAETDLVHNRITSIEFCRNYEVTAEVEFCGDYASLGNQTIGFEFFANEKYEFTHVTAEFVKKSVTIGNNSDDQLELTFVVGDDATSDDYTIGFTSSDPEIVSVNNDGVIKGHKISEKPVVITMKFDYLGKTYVDTCEVLVLKKVTSMLVSPEKAALKKGETVQLTYKIKPDDATIQRVMWFTEDESVAVIDENGLVTAVSNGKTKVYAVSVDGLYRDSCTITVEG